MMFKKPLLERHPFMSGLLRARTMFIAMGVAASFGFVAPAAHALPQLRIITDSTTLTIADNGGGDEAPTEDGKVKFDGTVDVFNVNVTGYTKPVLGTETLPMLDLFSLQLYGSGATIQLLFTDTDFIGNGLGTNILSHIGGTTSGTIEYQTYVSTTNDPFAMDTLVNSSGLLTGPTFSYSSSSNQLLSGPYSLTLVLTVTHPDGEFVVSSSDALVQVPAPGFAPTLTIGALLFGAGFVRQRRRKRR